MYYILMAILGFLIFVLFLKALGAVVKSIITTLFVLACISVGIIMFKSLRNPVYVLGRYKVDRFVVTKIN